ncbi:Kinase-interacting family protein [Abeliophyllum distichum]|uniref:Kinase-interacting family protein n=1 Tax=Abeliophyllum distichum TaxID=126358 RepID=A0ABD1PD88_9LAMI
MLIIVWIVASDLNTIVVLLSLSHWPPLNSFSPDPTDFSSIKGTLKLDAKMVKTEKTGGEVAQPAHKQLLTRSSLFNKPSWLLCTIADLDERIKLVTLNSPTENNADSFAARANSYYEERPQLLALLQDLYNACLSLADRYCRELAKNCHSIRYSSPIPPLNFDDHNQFDGGDAGEAVDSDAESSLSFQSLPVEASQIDPDMIIADLVLRNVECEFILNEVILVENRWRESLRKIELQQNLLDVLESERLILLNDNATLEYRVTSLVEENKGLASESLFLKRKASELARCVLKMRDDHRVCMLSRKIEDLQGQIYGLEKRNKEYHEYFVKQDKNTGKKDHGGKQVSLEDCLQVNRSCSCGDGGRPIKCSSADLEKDEQSANAEDDNRVSSNITISTLATYLRRHLQMEDSMDAYD